MADPVAEELIRACAILDGEGLTDAFGHVSARREDTTILLTPRLGPGLVSRPSEIAVLNEDGAILAGDGNLVPGEWALHVGIYAERDTIGAVVRMHGPACAAWATTGKPLPVVLGQGMFLGGEVPIHDGGSTVTDISGGRALSASMGGATAVLLRGFGQAVSGMTIAEAVVRAVFLERNASAALRAAPAGGAQPFSQEQVDAFMSRPGPRAEQVKRMWTYLVAKHVDA